MLDSIKLALRIKTSEFDSELLDLIAACKKDLALSGVDRVEEEDALVERAAVLYCKAYFGTSDKSEQFARSYEALKCSMSLAGDYRA